MQVSGEIAFAAHLRVALRHRFCPKRHICTAARSVPTACARAGKKNAGESAAVTSAVNGGVPREVAERVIGSVQRARNSSVVSEFVPWNDAEVLLRCVTRSLPYARSVITGGTEEAERAVLVSAPLHGHGGDEELIETACSEHLAAIAIQGELQRGNVSQRDLLGAVLAQIDRRRVGDVTLGSDGAGYAICHEEIADYLSSVLTSVGKVNVETSVVTVDQVAEREKRVKEMYSVEKSTRLDAVGSAGFKISRSKMADYVRQGNVKVNQQVAKKVALNLCEGDTVSIRGFGKLSIGEIRLTSKGNKRISLLRYL